MMRQPKPCPVCGGTDLHNDVGKYLHVFEARCGGCGGRVCYYDTKTQAITVWNRRTDNATT